MTNATPCKHCEPSKPCGRCGKPFPHSRNECDLVERHELTIFGVQVVLEAELNERGSASIHDLDGPLLHSVNFRMKVDGAGGTAGASTRTIEHGVDWLYEQAKRHRAEERAHYAAKHAQKDSTDG
jgi:hypothetical protein